MVTFTLYNSLNSDNSFRKLFVKLKIRNFSMNLFFYKKYVVFFVAIFLLNFVPIHCQEIQIKVEGEKKFEYKYKENDSYRILSTVEEDVFVNNIKLNTAKILNRVSVKVHDVDETNMTAINEGTFMTSEISTKDNGKEKQTFTYGEEYYSSFKRDRFGVYTISDDYFMPTVRDVPVFPDRKIKSGDEWDYEGHEVHDLRRTFGLQKPYKVPFTAHYTYLGVHEENTQDEISAKKLDVFQVFYEISFTMDVSNLAYQVMETPYKTSGFSSQLIFWDNERGTIDHYTESFRIMIETTAGNVLTFVGTAHAEVTEFERTSTVENLETVAQKIEELELDDVTVKQTDKGLTLSIENIQFKPDSDILLYSEKQKLDKLKKILESYPNNDILVTGHTALRGTKDEQEKLSQERAESVANYLIEIGVRDKYHIFTQGKGAQEPIATNTTETGRKKNRRVEITIMD